MLVFKIDVEKEMSQSECWQVVIISYPVNFGLILTYFKAYVSIHTFSECVSLRTFFLEIISSSGYGLSTWIFWSSFEDCDCFSVWKELTTNAQKRLQSLFRSVTCWALMFGCVILPGPILQNVTKRGCHSRTILVGLLKGSHRTHFSLFYQNL